MKATIMNIDACRNELAREILQTNDIEVLKKVRQAYLRIRKQAESKAALVASSIGPYTQKKCLLASPRVRRTKRMDTCLTPKKSLPGWSRNIFFMQVTLLPNIWHAASHNCPCNEKVR